MNQSVSGQLKSMECKITQMARFGTHIEEEFVQCSPHACQTLLDETPRKSKCKESLMICALRVDSESQTKFRLLVDVIHYGTRTKAYVCNKVHTMMQNLFTRHDCSLSRNTVGCLQAIFLPGMGWRSTDSVQKLCAIPEGSVIARADWNVEVPWCGMVTLGRSLPLHQLNKLFLIAPSLLEEAWEKECMSLL